jgi:uncharacterized protein (DUF2267 family)
VSRLKVAEYQSAKPKIQEDSMDELIKMVSSKVGISEAQAKEAVEIVIGFLKDKLPSPVAGQIDAVLEGDMDVGGVAGKLGGMFGKK